ncbi:MAG TPA: M1 family metallopeptidase [Thermoanaerobaculia bacterium]|nr:M1 family metallopeptidase [Thermoanaerobaculia bacterium]
MRPFRFVTLTLAVPLLLGAAELPAWRLDPRVSPLAQQVELRLDPAEESYEGSTSIRLRVSEPVESFRLHAEEMEIRSLTLRAGGEEIAVRFETAPRAIVEVRGDRPLAPGEYRLEIAFANEFDRRAVGLYRVTDGDRRFAFTQFEATDARKAFPSWDEPQYKNPFRLTISAPKDFDVVTNTPAEARSVEGEWQTIRFAETKPLPTYLLAIAVGRFDRVPIEGMGVPGSIWTVRGKGSLAALAAAEIPRVLAEMERWFGRKYPYEKLDFIAVPEYWPGAMEHPGAITFAENIILLDEARSSFSQRRRQSKVIAHELAHQWFGNLVTMQWWDDLWLNETFADWLGDKVAASVHPEFRVELSEMQQVQNVMSQDARPSADPVRSRIDHPEQVLNQVGLAYNKGKSVLAMFEQWVGEEEFRRGVHRYLEQNAWGNATSADLWSALAEKGKKQLPAAMATFIEQPGYPILELVPLEGGSVRISQRRFLNAGAEAAPLRWQVPVALRYSAGGETADRTVLLDGSTKTVRLASGDLAWVHPHRDGVGYYRWTLPPAAMIEMAAAAPQRLNPRERMAFVGNLAALLDGGEIGGGDFVRILGEFASDPEPLVVSAVVPQAGKIELAFVTPDLEPAFASWIRATFRPALERIGLASREGEDETVTTVRAQLLALLAGDGRDPEIRAYGTRLARRYMEDPASVDASLAGVALQIAAHEGDEALFEEYRRRFETAATPVDRQRYLGALAAFEDPALVDAAFAYALEGPLRPNEILDIPFGTLDGDRGRDRLFEFVTGNWDEITKRVPPFTVPFLPFIGGGCEEGRMAKARAFFAEPAHHADGMDRQLGRTADQVAECVRLRRREGAAVAKVLRGPDEPRN